MGIRSLGHQALADASGRDEGHRQPKTSFAGSVRFAPAVVQEKAACFELAL